MRDVIETMRVLPQETIANAPAIVRGLCVVRGKAVVVIDTAVLFGSDGVRYERLITVRAGEQTIAFAASAVLGVQSIIANELADLPPLLRDADAIAAIGRLDQGLVFFLRATRALPDGFLVDFDSNRINA
jgi:chemotaxis signal transduction protein